MEDSHEGLLGILGNKGTRPISFGEYGNMKQILGDTGTKRCEEGGGGGRGANKIEIKDVQGSDLVTLSVHLRCHTRIFSFQLTESMGVDMNHEFTLGYSEVLSPWEAGTQ